MQPNRWILCGALLGALGVAMGAFGAHFIKNHPEERFGWPADEVQHRLDIYETAVRYQMVHAAMLVIVGILGYRKRSRALQAAAGCFLLGIFFFSGLLYALTFVGPALRWLGAVVPIGGLLLIAGWLALGASCCCEAECDKA